MGRNVGNVCDRLDPFTKLQDLHLAAVIKFVSAGLRPGRIGAVRRSVARRNRLVELTCNSNATVLVVVRGRVFATVLPGEVGKLLGGELFTSLEAVVLRYGLERFPAHLEH